MQAYILENPVINLALSTYLSKLYHKYGHYLEPLNATLLTSNYIVPLDRPLTRQEEGVPLDWPLTREKNEGEQYGC
jgi:hypothetical protein